MLILVPLSGLLILLGLLYAPVVRGLAQVWWTDPTYSHGFLIPLVAGYFLWRKDATLRTTTVRPSPWGLLILALALLCLVAGRTITMAGGARGAVWVEGISLLLGLAGVILLLLGKAFLVTLAFPLAYLAFMLPLPEGILLMVTLPLQSYATSVTIAALQICNVPVLREGHLIHLSSGTLGVTEACSGINSLLTLLAGAVALSALALEHWWQRLLLMSSVVPIAVVTNAVRVTGTGLLAHLWGDQVAQGFFHGFSGWIIFLVASGLLCTAMLLLAGLPDAIEPQDRS